MRHTKEQLFELIQPKSENIIETVTAGIVHLSKLQIPHIYEPHKRAIFSGVVRSLAFDYLKQNPIEGWTLQERKHRQNQSIVFYEEESKLELRILCLKNIRPVPQLKIPRINEDPVITDALLDLDLQFQEPGVVGLSWERPKLDKGGLPLEEIRMTAVRACRGTKIKDGQADAVFPLYAESSTIPKYSFDPNEDDYGFDIDDDSAQDYA